MSAEEARRRLADPDWRLDMPRRWRLTRWLSLWWPLLVAYAIVCVAYGVLAYVWLRLVTG